MRSGHQESKNPRKQPPVSRAASIAMIIGISAEITAYETGTDRILAYILVGLGVVLTASAYWPVLHSSSRVVRFFSAAGINALTRMMDFS